MKSALVTATGLIPVVVLTAAIVLASAPSSAPQPVGGSSVGSLLPGELAEVRSGAPKVPTRSRLSLSAGGAPNTRRIVPAYDPRHPVPKPEVTPIAKQRAVAVRPARSGHPAPVRRVGLIRSRAIAASWQKGYAAGRASHMGSGYPSTYLALPIGRGYTVRICGAGGCVTMTSNDAGPSLAMQRAGRVADLSRAVFTRVCGLPPSAGLCPVSVTVLGR